MAETLTLYVLPQCLLRKGHSRALASVLARNRSRVSYQPPLFLQGHSRPLASARKNMQVSPGTESQPLASARECPRKVPGTQSQPLASARERSRVSLAPSVPPTVRLLRPTVYFLFCNSTSFKKSFFNKYFFKKKFKKKVQ